MKTLVNHLIVLTISTLAFASCNSGAAESGVEINGVTWAASNIAEPGKFTAAPHETGPHLNFETSFAAQNPCPRGWRIPGYADFTKLTDSQSVSCEWATVPGKRGDRGGLKFTDLATGGSIFLPAAGMIDESGECCHDGECCFYWSMAPRQGELPAGIPVATNGGYFLHFDHDNAARKDAVQGDKAPHAQYRFTASAPRHRFSVRCVKAAEAI